MEYFVADTNFNHENIIKYCSRRFKDLNEMNEDIINKWNSVVTKDDIICLKWWSMKILRKYFYFIDK